MRALGDIAAREADVLQAYTPGAVAEKNDVAQPAAFSFVLDPLSAAPPVDAYFVVAGDRAQLLFTRDGSFAVKDGVLVDDAGRSVLGYAGGASALAPLRADPVDVALGFVAGARVETDGSVTYERATIDPRTGRREMQRASLGHIALARFAPGTKLQSVDTQHLTAPTGVTPHFGRASDGNFSAIAPFARSNSGVDLDLGLQRLQDAYLALDAIRAAGKAQGSIQKTAMDLLK
jgi:flagellar basal body rod protein FlgG